VFHEERCKGCELCVTVCPKKIIKMADRFNTKGFRPAEVTEQDKCISCAICARICPDCVIDVYREPAKKEG
jgi:2-oxoglutarate ferredoxin oxidoreductase subunit delta